MSRPQQKRSRVNTAGEDGEATTQATTKLWTAMEPPEIICFLHEALVKWRRERELYEAAVHSRCQESGETLATVMIPAIKAINRRRLKTFSELELKVHVDDMANEKLVTAINQIVGSMMNDQIPNVDVIMSQHLKMDLKQKDVKARVLNYFDRFDELIEEYGLSIALDEQKKTARRLFMEKRKEGETAKMKRLISESGQIEPKHVAFNQAVTMPYHTDNGTKYNVVPRRIVEAIQQVCCNVKTQRLSTPIEGKAIGGAIIICNESIRLDL
ncbi:hypothetical protein PPTG_06600 [Phytophthora nicotianae INRA-310]|uniref:Uncharacterized protein n=2 Tax=Phytophthora nicotianae TaxID=4792 RepID=W2QST4_PHYN3|nr:hypothetical protein PPTG_06600 [Phytophthora nicotianae INRA-310]ETN15315.1 hypothetical protein PPTG_06600 [Phytophthora nicotianae INRA-310]